MVGKAGGCGEVGCCDDVGTPARLTCGDLHPRGSFVDPNVGTAVGPDMGGCGAIPAIGPAMACFGTAFDAVAGVRSPQ